MSKIAIVSNAEEGVVIDLSGCDSPAEAKHYLASTLQVSSRFWEGLTVDLNLGTLSMSPQEVAEILAIVREVGVDPSRVLSSDVATVSALYQVTHKEPEVGVSADDATVQSCADSPCSALPDQDACATVLTSVMELSESNLLGSGANNLPALSVEGQELHAGNLSFAHADLVSAAVSVAATAAMHQPLAVSAHINEVASAGREGGQSLAMTSAAVPVVGVMQRVATEPVSNSNKLDSSNDGVSPPVVIAVPVALPGQPTASSAVRKPARAVANSTAKAALRTSVERSGGVLYLRQTLRSGQAVTHKGDLVIIGDVNPGAEVSAEGDITIWGALRGVAHAGTAGNAAAEIRALKFDPIQLRIAHAIARAPDRSKAGPLGPSGPETARIVDGKIRISSGDPD